MRNVNSAITKGRAFDGMSKKLKTRDILKCKSLSLSIIHKVDVFNTATSIDKMTHDMLESKIVNSPANKAKDHDDVTVTTSLKHDDHSFSEKFNNICNSSSNDDTTVIISKPQ